MLKLKKNKVALFLLLALLFGLVYRLFLINIFPQPFIFDQIEYDFFAQEIDYRGLFAVNNRLYGYPLILSIIYHFAGVNHQAVFLFQIILDCLTGFLVFLTCNKLFKNNKIALTSSLFYLANPFTSAYTGVVLSEVSAIFLMTLSFCLFISFLEKKSIFVLAVLSLVLGFLPQVRPVFLLFTVLTLVLLIWHIFKQWNHSLTKKIIVSLMAIIYFSLPFTYNIIGNLAYFKQLSPIAVGNNMVSELYVSLYITKVPPHQFNYLPQEVYDIFSVYSVVPQNAEDREKMASYYKTLAIEKIKSNPLDFIKTRFQKMYGVWEKTYFFYYKEPPSPLIFPSAYLINSVYFFLALIGLLKLLRQRKLITNNQKVFLALTIVLFLYITLVHTVTGAEERYSLPAYPILLIFSTIGIRSIFLYRKRFSKKTLILVSPFKKA